MQLLPVLDKFLFSNMELFLSCIVYSFYCEYFIYHFKFHLQFFFFFFFSDFMGNCAVMYMFTFFPLVKVWFSSVPFLSLLVLCFLVPGICYLVLYEFILCCMCVSQ